jgi:Ca2+-binding RTX toxin-like protein
VFLTPEDDTYTGNPGPSTMFAKPGDDLIYGDPETGDPGRDRIFGGKGNDDLYGRGGRDKIFGDEGNDVIVAGDDKVADEVDGGGGFDICYLSGSDHSSLAQRTCEEVISFGPNDDLSETENPGAPRAKLSETGSIVLCILPAWRRYSSG